MLGNFCESCIFWQLKFFVYKTKMNHLKKTWHFSKCFAGVQEGLLGRMTAPKWPNSLCSLWRCSLWPFKKPLETHRVEIDIFLLTKATLGFLRNGLCVWYEHPLNDEQTPQVKWSHASFLDSAHTLIDAPLRSLGMELWGPRKWPKIPWVSEGCYNPYKWSYIMDPYFSRVFRAQFVWFTMIQKPSWLTPRRLLPTARKVASFVCRIEHQWICHWKPLLHWMPNFWIVARWPTTSPTKKPWGFHDRFLVAKMVVTI